MDVASAIHKGVLTKRITCTHSSPLKTAINDMADQLQYITQNVMTVAHKTAVDGKLGVQAEFNKDKMKGAWKDITLNLNSMTKNHLEQVRDIADVCTAIARGDLSKSMTVSVNGETLMLKNTFNTMGKKHIQRYCNREY